MYSVGYSLINLAASLLVFTFSPPIAMAIGAEPDVIFQKDVDRETSLLESYPIKLCIGNLGNAAMAAKMDDSNCRRRSDISYDDCMKIGKEGRDFSQLIVNKTFKAKAGDVICYSGHVAIYDGNGGIVEAKGTKWGITHDRRANCKTILAIRRFT